MNPRRAVVRVRTISFGTFTGYRCRKKLWNDVIARPRGVVGSGWRIADVQARDLLERRRPDGRSTGTRCARDRWAFARHGSLLVRRVPGRSERSRPPTSRPVRGRSVGHRSTQSEQRMHRSSWSTRTLDGCSGSTPSIASAGRIRMHFSGQTSTQPPHRMHSDGSSMMFRKHWRQRPASARACSSVKPSSISGEPIRRSVASTGTATRIARCSARRRGRADLHDRQHASPGQRRPRGRLTGERWWIEAAARRPSAIASIRFRGPKATSPPA